MFSVYFWSQIRNEAMKMLNKKEYLKYIEVEMPLTVKYNLECRKRVVTSYKQYNVHYLVRL